MSLLLAIHSFPGANEALQRHWPRFLNVGADEIWTIGTEGGGTWGRCQNLGKNLGPIEQTVDIGVNSYIDSEHLPNRLLKTLDEMLKSEHDWLLVAEYDTLFFQPILWKQEGFSTASHLAGVNRVGKFYHNPWLFERGFAKDFVQCGRDIVKLGACTYNSLESSPDVFFGLVCDMLSEPVKDDLWTQFSRNSYDIPGHLELAREAYRDGIQVIHGIKTEKELEFILS